MIQALQNRATSTNNKYLFKLQQFYYSEQVHENATIKFLSLRAGYSRADVKLQRSHKNFGSSYVFPKHPQDQQNDNQSFDNKNYIQYEGLISSGFIDNNNIYFIRPIQAKLATTLTWITCSSSTSITHTRFKWVILSQITVCNIKDPVYTRLRL